MPGHVDVVRALFIQRLRDALIATLAQRNCEQPAPLLLVTGVTGLGKTTIISRLLARQSVAFFSPRRAMLDDVLSFARTPLDGVEPLPGPGSDAPVIERMLRKEDGLCTQYQARIVPLRKKGLGRHEAAMGCNGCPDRNACGYLAWQPSAQWLHAPHRWLGLAAPPQHRLFGGLAPPKLFNGRDVVVIDESPLSDLLQAVTFFPPDIDALATAFEVVAESDNPAFLAFRQLFLACRATLAAPPSGVEAVELRSFLTGVSFGAKSSNKLASAARRLGMQHVDPAALRDMYAVPGLQLTARQRVLLSGLADALAADVIRERPTCVLRLPSTSSTAGIAAGLVRLPDIPLTTPVVVLDATADLAIYSRLFRGRQIIDVGSAPELIPDQTARVFQAVDLRRSRYTGATLTNPDGHALDKLLSVVDRQRQLDPMKRHAAILKKGCDPVRVRQTFPNPDDVGAFWGVRGTNEFADHDVLTVVGAPELPPLETEAMARAFLSLVRVIEGAPLPTTYRAQVRELSDRRVDRGYPRGFEHHIYVALHQREYEQAIGRARIYDGRSKTVYFLSSVRLDSVNAEVIDLDELLGKKKRDLVRMANDYLLAQRSAGRAGRIKRSEVAQAIGVTPAALGMAVHREPDQSLAEQFAALRAATV